MNSKKRLFHRKGREPGDRPCLPLFLGKSLHQGEPEPASGPVAPSISLLLSGGRVLKGAFPFGQSFPASLNPREKEAIEASLVKNPRTLFPDDSLVFLYDLPNV